MLVSSDAARAMQTAQLVGEAVRLPVRAEPRLRERGLGHWEGLTRDEVERALPGRVRRLGRRPRRQPPGGETRGEVADRALAAFAELPEVGRRRAGHPQRDRQALCNALLGLGQGGICSVRWRTATGRNCTRQHADGGPRWRLRGHNLGAPGVGGAAARPTPAAGEDAADADA